MKELIGTAVFIVGLVGSGNFILRKVHDTVRGAALRKVAQGLPPLPRFQKSAFVAPHR